MGLGLDVGSAWDAFSGGVGDLLPAVSTNSAASLAGYAPWISAGATLLGSMMNNNTSRSLASQQQAFSAAQAASIYQRGAADLAAAGINPILAYGSPAQMASYTQPNIQPSLALAVQSFNSALDSHISAKYKNSQQGLTTAQTATERKRPALVDAQTSATSASDANTRMDTTLKAEHVQIARIEQKLKSGQIGLQDLQAVVLQSQAYLNSASAKSHLSSAALSDAHANLAHIESVLRSPEVRSVLEHPDLHQAGKTSSAVADLAKPIYSLLGSLPTVVTKNFTFIREAKK